MTKLVDVDHPIIEDIDDERDPKFNAYFAQYEQEVILDPDEKFEDVPQ